MRVACSGPGREPRPLLRPGHGTQALRIFERRRPPTWTPLRVLSPVRSVGQLRTSALWLLSCPAMMVDALWRYPVKSAQGESISRSIVTSKGLEWDRQIAIVDEATARALTARREPRLLRLTAVVTEATRVVLASCDGEVLDSDEALSEWLGRPVRLARPPTHRPPEYEFPQDPEDEAGLWGTWVGPVGVWHDSSRTQVSILSTTSMRDWNVRRFRPNVVVDESDETKLVGRRVGVGSVVLDVMKRIDRCVIVTRPQPGGITRDLNVLRAVLRDSEGFLGVGALVAQPGQIVVGDEVHDLGPSPG